MKRALLLAALCTCACGSERSASSDELTIVVQADRREVEQQEKALREREDSLAKDKAQLDQRIADLAKGLKAAADAEQRRRLEEELRQSQVLEGQLGVRVSALQAQLKALRRWGSKEPADLSTIHQPVLVANGESDRMVPTTNTHDLARRLPNSDLIIYPDSGHGAVFQFHADFVPKALEFLAR